jgi:hypothetical protein
MNLVIDIGRHDTKFGRSLQNWVTLPLQSGTMSQLYRGFSWISMKAYLAGATGVASMLSQFDPFTKHIASP